LIKPLFVAHFLKLLNNKLEGNVSQELQNAVLIIVFDQQGVKNNSTGVS
jgi:hypothetical protein